MLAEDLVACGFSGEATVEVASLHRGASLSDAEPLVQSMLAEHGINLSTPGDERAGFRLLLRAFGFWDLPMSDFSSSFLLRLPSWNDQDDLERALIVLLDQFDDATDSEAQRAVEGRMRAEVRNALGS